MGTTTPTPRSRVPRRPWRLLSEDVPLIPENAVDLFPEKLGPRIFYLPSANAILKKGPTVGMAEAEAMRFVKARLPGVPVPEVYQSFIKDELGFILMEKIEGRPLAEVWDRLDDEKRRAVMQQLRGFVEQWRGLHGTWYGSLGGGSSIANYGDQSHHHHPHHRGSTGSSSNGSDTYNPHTGETEPPAPPTPAIEPGSGPGGPCEDLVFKHLCLAQPGEQKTYGPFSTRVDYNLGVIEALRNSRATGQLNDTDEPLVARIRAQDAFEEKVFTHGDLQPVNIMVDPKTLRITGILDWETAGYSPPEREYCEARSRGREEGWRRGLDALFDEDVREKYKLWRDIDWALVAHSRVWSNFLESSEMMLRERNHLSATSATYPPPRAPRAPALFCLPRGNTSHHSSAARSSFLSSSSASSGGLFGGVERAWAADGQGQRARARDSTFDTSRDGKRRRRENAVHTPHKRLRTGRERRTGLEHQWRDGDG